MLYQVHTYVSPYMCNSRDENLPPFFFGLVLFYSIVASVPRQLGKVYNKVTMNEVTYMLRERTTPA